MCPLENSQAWDWEANLKDGLAEMCFATGPKLWKIRVEISSSLFYSLKCTLELIELSVGVK